MSNGRTPKTDDTFTSSILPLTIMVSEILTVKMPVWCAAVAMVVSVLFVRKEYIRTGKIRNLWVGVSFVNYVWFLMLVISVLYDFFDVDPMLGLAGGIIAVISISHIFKKPWLF